MFRNPSERGESVYTRRASVKAKSIRDQNASATYVQKCAARPCRGAIFVATIVVQLQGKVKIILKFMDSEEFEAGP